METFARDTRHRPRQLESDEDVNRLVRKFLCTQVPTFVDWKLVYPFVSDDLESINFRAPNVLENYASLKTIEPKELQELLGRNNLKLAKKVPIFVDYCEFVQPPIGKEVLTFFLHGQSKKNLMDHVTALGVDNPQEMCRRIKAYQVPLILQGPEMIASLGLFLAEIAVDPPGVVVDMDKTEEDDPQEEDEDEEDEPVELPIEEPKEWKEEEHWENPILKAFKIEAGLSTQFSCKNVYKQMICAAANYPAPSHIMGKFQSEIPKHDGTPDALVDCLSSETVRQVTNHPECRAAYWQMKDRPTEARTLLKKIIADKKLQSAELVESLIQ